MDYLFFKPLKNSESANPTLELCKDQIVGFKDAYYYAHRPSTVHYFDDESKRAVFISGKVRYQNQSVNQSLKQLLNDVMEDKWPLSDAYDGMFSGIALSEDKVVFFNDPIGIWHLYYSYCEDYIAVTTNLNSMKKLTGKPLKMSSLVLESTGGEFAQYGTSTILEDVYTLLPGECRVLKKDTSYSLYDTTIKTEDKIAPAGFASELVEYINEKTRAFYNDETKFIASLSGGIDSRINIASLGCEQFNYHFVNYGNPAFIDSKIPKKMAAKLGKKIEIVDSTSVQFPELKVLEIAMKETDSVYVNSWFSVLYSQRLNNNYPSFLLGDMCDILRSKGISSIKTRAFRRNFYIRKFLFRQKLQLTPLSVMEIEDFKTKKIKLILANAEKAMNFLRIEPANRARIIGEIKNDISELFVHLEKYKAESIESYEELFGIFTHGRRSMGKQLNLLKCNYVPYIPLSNLQVIRKVLNVSPVSRYSDELTNAMFKHKTWQFLGSFPTSQNPFIAYNSNYYLMVLGWFLRSFIDQVLITIHVRTGGKFKRQRLFQSIDFNAMYAYPGSFENFKSCFDKRTDFQDLITIFNGRLNKTLWPLSGMDLMPYVQTSLYLRHLS